MSITNPTISTLADPKGLDVVFESLATRLEDIPWLTKGYGIADNHYVDGESFPAIWTGSDYLSMKPDEHLGNYSFFQILDPHDLLVRGNQAEHRGTARVVFFWNWEDVYADHRSYENIKFDILEVLKAPMVNAHLEIKKFYKDSVNIWKGYKLDPSLRPYGCCAVEFTFKTMSQC